MMTSHPFADATCKIIIKNNNNNQAQASLDLTQVLPCPFLMAALVLPSRYTGFLHCSELKIHMGSHLPAPLSAVPRGRPRTRADSRCDSLLIIRWIRDSPQPCAKDKGANLIYLGLTSGIHQRQHLYECIVGPSQRQLCSLCPPFLPPLAAFPTGRQAAAEIIYHLMWADGLI